MSVSLADIENRGAGETAGGALVIDCDVGALAAASRILAKWS